MVGADLALYRDPAILLDGDGQPVAANAEFERLVLGKEGRSFAMFNIESLGVEAGKACQAALQGHFAETSTLIESRDGVSDWRVTCLPARDGLVLVLLTSRSSDIAFFDALTKLPNRRSATERLEREWERWLRSKHTPFGLALADIDHFKKVNDSYGHDTGDQVLRMVSEAFNAALRRGDWVARWGGEEFLLLFHDVGRKGVLAVADRCRQEVARAPWRNSSGLSIDVSVSMGVVPIDEQYAGITDSSQALETLLSSADLLMYDAKNEGRNRCIVQGAKERLHWNGAEVDATLKSADMFAACTPIVDAKDKTHGSFWVPKIKGMGARAASHFFHSALRENKIDEAETAFLKQVQQGLQKEGDRKGLVAVACNNKVIRRLDDCPSFRKAIEAIAEPDDVQLMLAAKNLEAPDRIREELAAIADGVELCPWFDGNSLASFSLADEYYQYIMLENLADAKPQAIENFLRFIKGTECRLIISGRKQDSIKIDHPHTLYLHS